MKLLTFHDELAVITKRMANLREVREPFRGPLPRAVRPWSSPLGFTPWIANHDEAPSVHLDCTQDGIGVRAKKAVDGNFLVSRSRAIK